LFATCLANDKCVAVSAYTRDLIVASARRVDRHRGRRFADECERRFGVRYPAVDAPAFPSLDPEVVDEVLQRGALVRDGYVPFLSRVTRAKGVDDVVAAIRTSARPDRRIRPALRGPHGGRAGVEVGPSRGDQMGVALVPGLVREVG
ncbi:MAG: hypothetical protein ACRDQD_29520, partial [Nocardioidaceae bacterium]